MSLTHKFTAIAASAALLGGTGFGVAQAAQNASTTAKSSSTQSQKHKQRPGRLSTEQLATVASKLGVTSAQLQAALDANRPAKPSGDPRTGMATELAKALGVEASQITQILEANRPERPSTPPSPGTRPPKPDQSKLVSALASGLNLDQATVKAAVDKVEAAHKAEHDARHTAMSAALAKALNLDASAVEAAFASVRPAQPTA